MEARLIHAHKIYTNDSSDERVWRIIHPDKHGIRVDESQIPHGLGVFDASVSPSVSRFLTDIAGEGGPWDGWTLYAVGSLMHTRSHDPTPFFQVVFVRRERTAEGRAGEGVEKVEGRATEGVEMIEGRATEGFEMIEGREEPTLYRQV